MKRIITSLTAFLVLFASTAGLNPVFADETATPETDASNVEVLADETATEGTATDETVTVDPSQPEVTAEPTAEDLVNALYTGLDTKYADAEAIRVDTTREEYTAALDAVNALPETDATKQGLLDQLVVVKIQLDVKDQVYGMFAQYGTSAETIYSFETVGALFNLINILPSGPLKSDLFDKQGLMLHYSELALYVSLLLDENGHANYLLETVDGDILELDDGEFALIESQVAELEDGIFKDVLTDIVTEAKTERDAYDYTITKGFGEYTGKGDLVLIINAPYNGLKGVEVFGPKADIIADEDFVIEQGSTKITLKEASLKNLPEGTFDVTAEYVGGKTVKTTFVVKNGEVKPVTPPVTPPVVPTDDKDVLPATGMGSSSKALYTSVSLIVAGAALIAVRKREEQ